MCLLAALPCQIFDACQISGKIFDGSFLILFSANFQNWSNCSLEKASDGKLSLEEIYFVNTLQLLMRLLRVSSLVRNIQLGHIDAILFNMPTTTELSQKMTTQLFWIISPQVRIAAVMP